MKKNNQSEAENLRQKAEEQLKNKQSNDSPAYSEAEMHKLIHELKVHQIELELQNQELILAKEQAAAAFDKYIELYDFAPSGYFTLNPKGEIVQLNLTGAAMLGNDRSRLINRLFHLFVSDDSKHIFNQFRKKVFESYTKQSCELTLLTGANNPLSVYLTGIAMEDSGQCFITAIDITERKQTGEALLKSESVHRKMVANIGDVIVVIDKDGITRYKSPNVVKLFGWKPEELVGASVWEHVHPEDSETTLNIFKSLLVEPNSTVTFECRYRCKNGSYKWIGVTAINLLEDPEINGILGNYHDISARRESDALLRESEQFLQNTQSIANLGTYSLDVNTGLWTSSKIMDKIFGIDQNYIRSVEGWISIIHPDWQEMMSNYFAGEVLGKRNQFDKEYQIIRQNDKAVRWVHGIGSLKFDKNNQVVGMLGIILDITDQKRNQELLKASEIKYHAIFENVQDVFYQTNLAGVVLEVSPSIENILGFSRDEIIGKSLAKLSFDFKSRDMFFYKLKENGELKDYELRLKTKAGEFKYTSINTRLIFDADGMPNHIDGAIRDITERKLAQVELKASKQFLHNIINAVSSPIFVKDINHKFFLVNNALCSLFNLPIEEIIGTTGYDYLPEEQMKIFIAKDNEVFETGNENINEELLTDGKGNLRTLVTRKTLYADPAGNKFLVGVSSDITERKLAEKQIQKLNRVYTVLSNINQTIVRTRDKQLLFGEVCRIAVDDGGFMMAWIGMVNSTTNKIDVVASSGNTGEYLNNINIDLNNKALNSGPAGLAIKTGKWNFSNNIETDDREFYWRKEAFNYGYQSLIALPLIVSGKTIGVYMIYSGEMDFFNKDEIKLLNELASDISFSLEFIESETERKQAEKALNESELKYHNIFNNVQDVFYQTNIAGTILEVSPSIKNFSEFSRDEIVGTPVTNLYFDPNDRVEILDLLKKKGELRDYELRLKSKTGEIKYTSINARLIFDADGRPNHIDGAIRDITERKLVQEKLTQSEERFKLAMQASKDGLFDWNLETNEIYYSPGWKKIIGFEDHELQNDFAIWEETTDPLDVRKSWELQQKLITKQIDRFVLEFKMKHKDGHWIDILSQATAFFNDDGKAIRIVGTHTNISERKKAEEALHESNRLLHESQAIAHIGAYAIELTAAEFGDNTWKASPEIYKILGIKETYPNTLESWLKIIHPDMFEEVYEQSSRASKEIKRYDMEYKIIRLNDRAERWVHATGEVECDDQRNPKRMLGTLQDITDRKIAEDALRQSIAIQRKIVSNIGDVIVIIDNKGNNTYNSPNIETLFGWKPEELLDRKALDIVHPDDRESIKKIADKIELEPDATETTEIRYRCKDGTYVWIEITLLNLLSDPDINGLLGNYHDITERRQREELLIKLKTAIEKSEVSVVVTDSNGTIEYANKYFSELTGYSADEYLGKTPGVLNSGFQRKEFYHEMWDTIKSGQTWEGEFYNRKKNGELYWENAIISPIENAKKEITHFVAIKTDITEEKHINSELIIAKEHAEESDRLKSAFLANMSHEIRTPMNGILGFAELLKEPNLSGDQQKYYIDIIEKSGARMLNIINDIVDISKIESGQMKVNVSVTNANEHLENIYAFFNPEAEKRGIKLIHKTGLPFEKAYFKTDGDKLYAVLVNLVKNALKYTETGSIEIGYELHDASLQFYIKDTGIGIPKDRQEAIFERFIQADIVDKMARQGAGLGLSISKAYIEMLGGQIWVDSEEGVGSTFYFSLPFQTNANAEKNTQIKIAKPVSDFKPVNLKILIAEDDEMSKEFILIEARKYGKEIIIVQTGTEAVEACRANPDIDLVLMDIQMPEMSGFEATRQIRKFNRDVTIIAQTSYALTGDREKVLAAGCTDYISKPINRNKLEGLIRKYFK